MTNMLDTYEVSKFSGLTREQVKEIIKNYSVYKTRYKMEQQEDELADYQIERNDRMVRMITPEDRDTGIQQETLVEFNPAWLDSLEPEQRDGVLRQTKALLQNYCDLTVIEDYND